MSNFLIRLFLLLLFLSSCSTSPKVEFRSYSKLIFLSNREAPKGQFDIFQMDLDGSNQINLTKDIEGVTSISRPVLSPDQSKVLFASFNRTGKSLQILDLHSGENVQLAKLETDVPRASFSPNGKNILFCNTVDGKRKLFSIDSDGSNEQMISADDGEDFDAVYSFDEKKIAFIRKTVNNTFVYIMDSDGSNVRKISDTAGKDGHPSISPDGKKIVFHSFQNGSNNIYIADIGKDFVETLFQSTANDVKPAFSPDGEFVLFQSNRRGMKYQDVFTINVKTRSTKVASNNINFINQNAMFSPDGKKIIFESVKFDNAEIYMVDPDGENLTNLTNHERWDCCPSF